MRSISKVVIGLSGGVDSAAAAYILKQQGFDVTGVTLKTGPWCDTGDAKEVARVLDIPFYEIDCAEEFRNKVTDPFVRNYIKGMTPNPCVWCNRAVKWESLTAFADKTGSDHVATGHYARITKTENGRLTLKMSAASSKDQTYMLYRLSQYDLKRTIMPLSELTKDEVRRTSSEAGLRVADKKDSQEICFVPEGHYAEFLASYEFRTERGNEPACLPLPGNFVDEDGNVLGPNKGIAHYTVGQRKGLGIALGYPAYVKYIDADTGNVVLAREDAVMQGRILCTDLNFMAVEDVPSGEKLQAYVKIRYHHPASEAVISRVDDNTVMVEFEKPVRAPAPGQSAVFYDSENRVIGGGIITQDR